MDLVIMAAGLGSRFGGLKQINPIDNNGNFIIDYSIFDAIKVGFDRVVFIIKKENFDNFDKTIGQRIKPFVEVDYAFQDVNSFLPENYKNLKREKPWGTAHAVLCAKDKVKSNFAVINADDFYGRNSFKVVFDFLNNLKDDKQNSMVAFKAINTISNNGEVKRGVCKIVNGNLNELEESAIRLDGNKLFCKPLNNLDSETEIDKDTLVSMNLFGLNKNIFEYLEKGFYKFLEANKNDLTNKEYFIPTILTDLINQNVFKMNVLKTDEKWYGLTYKEDYDVVFSGIKELINKGKYPKSLWKN